MGYTHITVNDPTNPFGVPLFDGDIEVAGSVLEDGTYKALGFDEESEDEIDGTLTVANHAAVFEPSI